MIFVSIGAGLSWLRSEAVLAGIAIPLTRQGGLLLCRGQNCGGCTHPRFFKFPVSKNLHQLLNIHLHSVQFSRSLSCLYLPSDFRVAYLRAFTLADDTPQRTDHNTGNSMPFSLRKVCGFFYVQQYYEH